MIEKAAKDYPQKTGEIFKDCNHSLERPGYTAANIKNVKKVVKKLKKMLREPKADQALMRSCCKNFRAAASFFVAWGITLWN